MNRIHVYFFVFIVLFVGNSCKAQHTRWEYNKTISQIEFEKLRYKLANKRDTLSVEAYLKSETIISGFPCAAGHTEFSKDFKLQLFKVSRDFELGKFIIPQNSWVSLRRYSRVYVSLPEIMVIQKYLCLGNGKIGGPEVCLDMEGNLRSFYSPEDIKIGSVYCLGGDDSEIGLFKNGMLEYCTISIAHSFNDVSYKAGTKITFDFNGNVSVSKSK